MTRTDRLPLATGNSAIQLFMLSYFNCTRPNYFRLENAVRRFFASTCTIKIYALLLDVANEDAQKFSDSSFHARAGKVSVISPYAVKYRYTRRQKMGNKVRCCRSAALSSKRVDSEKGIHNGSAKSVNNRRLRTYIHTVQISNARESAVADVSDTLN